VEKSLTIPDENVGVLSSPADGISTEGLTRQEGCEKILRAMYQAVIAGDLVQLRILCPLCKNMNDEFLRAVILRIDKEDRIVDIVKVGQIFKTGRSNIGPIVAVPVVFKLGDGRIAEQNMIIQIRQLGGKSSCVIHGPYGLPREIE
jgi:hypothetical protein